jgi:hypothetical protein
MNIPTNLKLIESGSIPTTSNLLKGQMAFGKVPSNGGLRLFINSDNSVFELTNTEHNNLIDRDVADCHPIDAITGLRDIINVIDVFYGVEWDITVSSPICRRIGNPNLHQTLPVHNKMKRCLLLDNGTVNYYLKSDDSTLKEDGTPAVLDGTDGQVMVEIPSYYRKFQSVGNKRRVMISEYNLPGFDLVPKYYRSAYEASLDRVQGRLCSVVNTTPNFRGGDNTSAWDSDSRSLLGKPVTNLSLQEFRQSARIMSSLGNVVEINDLWCCDVYTIQRDVHYLYIIEYANLDCQLPFNSELTPEGYKQGGLGNGVTTLNTSQWPSFNHSNPFIPCGYTNHLGNNTGMFDFIMPPLYGTTLTVQVPSYRGLENPFGHTCSWTDGCKCRIQGDNAGGLSEFYVCNDPFLFDDLNYTNYELRGLLARENGYIREMLIGENMPSVVSGSSSTYFCDYFFTSTPSSGEVLRGVLFGGTAASGAGAGFGFAFTNLAPSAAYADVGSRLCYIPSTSII